MLGKHSLSTANAYDTEALEDALEGACGGNIKITQRLELRRLATSLWYDTEMNKQGTIQQNHNEPLKALTNIKANLQRRKKTSDILTCTSFEENIFSIFQPLNIELQASYLWALWPLEPAMVLAVQFSVSNPTYSVAGHTKQT